MTAATFRLDGRLALVTGSSTGIGLALARALGQAGARVVLNARGADKLHAAQAQLQAEGLTVYAEVFDVTDPAAVDAALSAIERNIGPLDILVNNAGGTRRAPFHELSWGDWRAIMDTNLDGLFIVARAAAQRMVQRRAGCILNICSVQSELGRPGTSAYAASKGAVKMLTKGMAVDLAPLGVRVNAIGPGYFKTELTAALVADEAFNSWLVNRTPARRWGDVQELGPCAVFLASDAASFIHGHVLYVDGAITASL
ncbi:MAG: glucose 1-dehydrogenase [Aquabacterium sp.]